MKGKLNKKKSRLRRCLKIRKKIKELNATRLVVHKTSKHMYAQIIDSVSNNVLVYASTLEKSFFTKKIYTGNKISAGIVGELIAKRALKRGIKKVSFDRSGFYYHGRVKKLAESARIFGLIF